nr:DUF4340 domain-containing protein [Phycisphaerae bacterium]
EDQGTYVREASSNDVYLTNDSPWIRTRPLDYVNQEIASIKREDVNMVTVTSPKGSYVLRAEKSGGDGVLMDNVPVDKKLKETDARSVFTALQGLRFDDVNTPTQVDGLTFDHKYVVRMDNSTEYTLELAKKGEKTYLKARAAYTSPAKVAIDPSKQDSPEELKKKEAILMAQEAAQRFTLRHRNWVYEIPQWKAKYLLMSQADLLEDKEKTAEVKEESASAVVPTLSLDAATTTSQAAEPNQTQ